MSTKKVYAVHKGRVPGIYETWSECQEQVKGVKNAKFRAFASREEAEAYVEFGVMKDAGTSQDPRDVVVFTDGACPSNGMQSRVTVAGVGAWFGPEHEWNVSEPFPYPNPTNQRAEIYAIIRALEQCGDPLPERNITVVTDSKYCEMIVNRWASKWKRNGWKTAAGATVKNRELIEEMVRLCRLHRVKIQHVRGHAGNLGNEMADDLAVRGANKPIPGKTKYIDSIDELPQQVQ